MTHSADKIELRVATDAEMQAYINKAQRMRSQVLRAGLRQIWIWLKELVQRKPRQVTAH
ncbi:MAG: hypothetical protein AAF415_06400 [Pseudomonadota bacterium]